MASGSPTESELQSQWRKTIDIIDKARTFGDGLVGSGQEFDLLMASLEGDITPGALSSWADAYREGLSSMVSPAQMSAAITPCIVEYSKVLNTAGAKGASYEAPIDIKGAIYEHFIDAPGYVESRALTFDTTATVTGTGNGNIARMLEDENGFDLEACHVEKKVFRCRRDKNSGVKEQSEEFELVAEMRSKDFLEANDFGSGVLSSATLRNRNSSSQSTGSLLRNSSFSSYLATATNVFTSWVLTGVEPAQDTTDYYIADPSASDAVAGASLKALGNFTATQTLANMRTNRLDTVRPYFLRVMVDATTGLAVGGDVTLTLGATSVVVSVATIAAATRWYEVLIPLDKDAWFKNFNQDDLSVSFGWDSRTSGVLYFDDMIFVGMTQIDGTYWTMRHTHTSAPTSWLVDDAVEFTDSQADTTKGKINYYLWKAGYGYLPHSTGTPTITFTDP